MGRRSHVRRARWMPSGLVDAGSRRTAPVPAEHDDGDDDSVPDPWIGQVLDGRFEVLDPLGVGGMATVYRARETGIISREVAIKLLSAESSRSQATVARFRKEAQLIADLHHPHVVHVFHVGHTAQGQIYIVMELLRGETLLQTLRDAVARGGAIPWTRLGPMMLQVCGALQAAHDRKVIHRDIKLSNCFRVDAAGHPDFIKLLDFGIAKVELAPDLVATEETPLTRQGMFLGTPHYAAPEIIEPQLCWPVDGRVDMFATGVVMYHCLTGTLPFAGLSHLDVLYKTVHERPPTPRERAPLRDIPPEVDALVMRAMAVHPDDRFADMAALARAIRETLAPRPASASSPTSASSLADAVARAQATADSLASAVARIRANASQSGRAVDPAGSAAHASLPTPAHDATPAPASPLPDPATLSERGAAIQDPEPRGFGGLIVTVGLMLLGLLALLLLLQQEIGRSRADPRPPREPPPASSPRPTATGS